MTVPCAVFLDKDGTVLRDVPYNVDPLQMRMCDGAATGLKKLHDAGYLLVVVTNQSGVAGGRFPESALRDVEVELRAMFQDVGAALRGFYYCPHHPDGSVTAYRADCQCRKPRPGMVRQAANDLQIDLAASWLIGDTLDDVEAGNRAGCRTILLTNGGETQWQIGPLRSPTQWADDLENAARIILEIETLP